MQVSMRLLGPTIPLPVALRSLSLLLSYAQDLKGPMKVT